ncbi:hypothetical protein, partial [Kitasatospora herbaricolor]|uniref:hypothetical protein n=1 Tax=Kitasatospora herbaricolor TaxID=68217 RepID=UPI0036D97852
MVILACGTKGKAVEDLRTGIKGRCEHSGGVRPATARIGQRVTEIPRREPGTTWRSGGRVEALPRR